MTNVDDLEVMMRLACVAIFMALSVQKPAWADTVYYCEETNAGYFDAQSPDGLRVNELSRFKMKVSEKEGITIIGGKGAFWGFQLAKYHSDLHWTAEHPAKDRIAGLFYGSFYYARMGQDFLRIYSATCEKF